MGAAVNRLPITGRLLLSYLLVAVLPLAGLAHFYLASFEQSLRETVLANMNTIADKKAEQIDSYMLERLADARLFSREALVHEAIHQLGAAFRAGGLNSPGYQAVERRFRNHFELFAQEAGYYDLLLLDGNGNVIFSLAHEADLGTNLRTGAYRDTVLAEGFELAVRTLNTHSTRFEPYAPSHMRSANFLVAPVLEESLPFGALALQVDISRLETVVSDRTGLGVSGETVLAQKSGNRVTYTAPLRHISDASYNYWLPLDKVALPMQHALAGAHDRGLVNDYAGVECVAAWRYLPVLGWGMVVKIDAAEALAPARDLRRTTYFALLLFLAFSGGAAYLLGRTLSRPIRGLTQVAERIAAGDLSARATRVRDDELGRLAGAFNRMADELLQSQHDLEAKVAQRTEELQRTLSLHGAILDHAAYAIIATNTHGVITLFNHTAERMLGYYAEELTGKRSPAILHDAQEVAERAQAFSRELAIDLQPGFEVFVIRTRLGLPNQFEWTYVRKDGSRFPVLLSVTALRSEKGEITGFLGIAMDISERKAAEAAVRESTLRLNEAQRIAQVGSWELDLASDRLSWSDEIYRIFELDPAHFSPSYETFLQAIHPDDREMVNQAYTHSLATRTPYEITHRLLMADGRIKWVSERCETLYDEAGTALRSSGTVQDVSARQQAEEALRLYAGVFEHSGEGILISDSENHIVAVNSAFSRMTGFTIEDIRGRNPSLLSSGHTPPQTYQNMWAALAQDGYWQGEIWDRRKDGSVYPKWMAISVVRSEAGKVLNYIASFTDVSERKAIEEKITHLAHHDALTGLFNRYSLQDRLEQALATVRRERRALATMFIDMDRFKTINDTLGHAVGDELLIEVANRLRSCVRESDIVARLGGDEFVVVLTEVEDASAAARVADKILRKLGQVYHILDNELHSSPSIGLAFYPDDGEDSGMLMKNADTAMYHAKSQGRNNVQFFTAAMNQAAVERLRLEHDLRVAVENKQFELYYQPQVDGRDGRCVGVEALVRWRHPRDGLISPLKFISIAEETGLIMPLGKWVLEEACRQLRIWRDGGVKDVSMAVNLSAYQLRSPSLSQDVARVLALHGLQGSDLELEVTESAAMDDAEASIASLRTLRELGVRLAMDDFGTGYSSLSYLKLLPIQTLKLDRSFVRDIESDQNDAAICTATIALAHTLGLAVVAEGVETGAQREFLASFGCDYLQGYLFSKPVPPAEALAFIQQAGEGQS